MIKDHRLACDIINLITNHIFFDRRLRYFHFYHFEKSFHEFKTFTLVLGQILKRGRKQSIYLYNIPESIMTLSIHHFLPKKKKELHIFPGYKKHIGVGKRERGLRALFWCCSSTTHPFLFFSLCPAWWGPIRGISESSHLAWERHPFQNDSLLYMNILTFEAILVAIL